MPMPIQPSEARMAGSGRTLPPMAPCCVQNLAPGDCGRRRALSSETAKLQSRLWVSLPRSHRVASRSAIRVILSVEEAGAAGPGLAKRRSVCSRPFLKTKKELSHFSRFDGAQCFAGIIDYTKFKHGEKLI